MQKSTPIWAVVWSPSIFVIIEYTHGTPWRRVLMKAVTPLLQSYGYRRKDFQGVDVLEDLDDKLISAFSGGPEFAKFDLWKLEGHTFIKVRSRLEVL